MTTFSTPRPLVTSLCLVTMGACSRSATPPATPPQSAPTTLLSLPTPAQTAPTAPSLADSDMPLFANAALVPDALAIDGTLDEWMAPGSEPGGAVFVAVDTTRLVLAASLPAGHPGGVTIALSFLVPELPDIGWVQRGGGTHPLSDERCQFEQVSLPEANWENGKAQPPEAVAACRALLKRNADFAVAYGERFVRRVRLTDKGAFSLDSSGNAVPIEGAVHHATTGAIEAQLPLTALPEVAEAPLTTLFAITTWGSLPSPLAPPTHEALEGWLPLTLPKEVSFQPHGDLRAAIFTDLEGSRGFTHAQLSYHPARPQRLITVMPSDSAGLGPLGASAPDRPVVIEDERTIFTPLEELGDVQVGVSEAHYDSLVTYRKGTYVASQGTSTIRGTKKHNGELHVFTYSPGGFTWAVGTNVPPRWMVAVVKQDGTIDDIADEGVDFIGDWNAWDSEPEPFSDPDFKAFGMHGKRGKKNKTVIWRWNEQEHKYTSSVSPKSQEGPL